jgi:glycosyltransferase involved in cell wall biosynthesis
MRILFVLINFPPSIFGGIASSMYPLIKELNIVPEYEVKVLTTNYKIPNKEMPITNCWSTFNEIAVNYIKTKNPFFSLNYLREGFRQIKKTDQVHLSSFFYFPNLLFLIVCIIYKKRRFLSPHGELLNSALKNKYWKKAPYLMLMKIFLKSVIFRATSDQEALVIKHFLPHSQIIVIPNFFKLGVPLKMEKLNQFLFLGRICNIKKIENLILACSLSKQFLANKYNLLIAGPTDNEYLKYETELKNLVVSCNLKNNIEFLGEVNSPIKEKLVSQSKALFVVSESENFSNVVVESLSQGTPVVASKGTPWQSLAEFNCGYWIDNSPESIATIIDEFISMNEASYKTMSENSIALSKEFTKDNVLPKWIKIIED